MNQHVKSSPCRFSNSNGQISLFVAIMFQLLFMFFAMVINVGLLVHHKINLQNSVDLAAYYGGTKQAEMLNAMAHINYQMRQSWKLLAFRYRLLGAAGERLHNPYKDSPTPHLVNDTDTPSTLPSVHCSYYKPLMEVTTSESDATCANSGNWSVPEIHPPAVISTWMSGFNSQITQLASAVNAQVSGACKAMGFMNFITLGTFVRAYRHDQANRKKLLYLLANSTSADANDFTDISGASVRSTVEKTLKKNLTAANLNSLSGFEFKNGLAECNGLKGQKGKFQDPPGWIKPIVVVPAFFFLSTICENGVAFGTKVKEAFGATTPAEVYLPIAWNNDFPSINQSLQFVDSSNLYSSTVGVEKDETCVAYVSVTAESAPKIPFSPFGAVKMKAQAYAKPFGGSMGPPYMVNGKKVDPLLPPRIDSGGGIPNPDDPSRLPNHSRYIGDKAGINSLLTIGQYSWAIRRLNPIDMSFNYWLPLIYDFEVGQSDGDALAWNRAHPEIVPGIRRVEIAAVAPDVFDSTYYSIDPDYFKNYYLKLKSNPLVKNSGILIRPDLGWNPNSQSFNSYSVKDQILQAQSFHLSQFAGQENGGLLPEKLTYKLKSFGELLTGWKAMSAGNYKIDTANFGVCANPVDSAMPKVNIAGSCVTGGRTGYSVKIVSKDALMKMSQTGQMKNFK
jgi:hypothetical protein